ncbi:MAG: leucine-rich repeat protein [Rikenellaceae bacterium]
MTIPSTTGNSNGKFTIDNQAATSTLTGQIITWDDEAAVYAIYPYTSSGYTVSNDAISYSITDQAIDASSSYNFENGLMVAYVSGATTTSTGSYNIPDLVFSQVMSFYQLELCDIPDSEDITEISLQCDSELFTTSATVDLPTATVTALTQSTTVSAAVSGVEGSEATINFALLPVDLSDVAVTLSIKTESDGNSKSYSKVFDSGVNFAQNSFIYNLSGAISLSSDFSIELLSGDVTLADIEANIYPTGNSWRIIDSSATTDDFEGLKAALSTIYSKDSSREISLTFPNLDGFPENALYEAVNVATIEAPLATTLGSYAFYGCSALETILLPEATSIGYGACWYCTNLSNPSISKVITIDDYAFAECNEIISATLSCATSIGYAAFGSCKKLTSISCPLVTSIDTRAFQYCSSLETIDFPKVKTIGSWAFEYTALKAISLPEATTISSYVFQGCSDLVSAYLPKVTSISSYAFHSCSSLTSLEWATDSETTLSSLASNIFYSTTTSDITLTIGESNISNVANNTLTIGSYSYTFGEIIIMDGDGNEVSNETGDLQDIELGSTL